MGTQGDHHGGPALDALGNHGQFRGAGKDILMAADDREANPVIDNGSGTGRLAQTWRRSQGAKVTPKRALLLEAVPPGGTTWLWPVA
jgi:hypothetical protein